MKRLLNALPLALALALALTGTAAAAHNLLGQNAPIEMRAIEANGRVSYLGRAGFDGGRLDGGPAAA